MTITNNGRCHAGTVTNLFFSWLTFEPACINRIRGLLAELGVVFSQSPAVLRQALPDALEDATNELSTTMIYTHVLKVAAGGTKSPLDALNWLTT